MGKTLWVFGDSFTFGNGCREDCPNNQYFFNYKKEHDDIWPNHLAQLLGMSIKNFGKNGASNEYIFDTIIQNFNQIQENDVVVISKTIFGRIEVPNDNSEWVSIFSTREWKSKYRSELWSNYLGSNFIDEELRIILDFQHRFSNHELYKKRYDERFNFIKNVLIDLNKVKSCFVWDVQDKNLLDKFELISQDTNGVINNLHWSFKGHYDFSRFVYDRINNNKKLF